MGRGPRTLPPDEPAVTPYRQTNRRQGDIFEKKIATYIFDKSTKKKIKIKKFDESEPFWAAGLAQMMGPRVARSIYHGLLVLFRSFGPCNLY